MKTQIGHQEAITKIANAHTEEEQLRQMEEEAVECALAIIKMRRHGNNSLTRKDLVTELADCLIMIEQLVWRFGYKDEVSIEMVNKINRELNRTNQSNFYITDVII
ncbi:hypothetical protein [Parasutterella muris]|uniref:hypothetical protein n=1 Tax=Parasutterella muris TaxID=2565572 RepID=UPI00203F7C2C|nr:hypothetical protein [Parasutterella muris]